MRAAIITVKGIRLAAVLVAAESTYPEAAQAVLRRAEQLFPALPVILISPRIQGFSRSYATFNIDQLIPAINADKIRWRNYGTAEENSNPVPF